MTLTTIILLSVGLAMDCFAVSLSKGLATKHLPVSLYPFLMAILFGVFQGGMPLIGYFFGTLFLDFVTRWSGVIALVLLSFIGSKMIIESLQKNEDKQNSQWRITELLVLSVATSIDALSTGVIFVPVPESLWLAVGIIALVSFLFSLLGYMIGRVLGKKFRLNATLLGGIILILIGIKIFIGY